MSTFPPAVLAQHIAILGKTGSGKTYAAKGIVEGILKVGGRVCIIDPTGAWHGLRSSASGKSAGFPVVIFGGSHADLPLAAGHGEALADIIGTSSTPAIIDTSAMKVSERTQFFADFADAIVRKNRGPLHLIVDEAHLFAPQGRVSDPRSGMMLHAANNLVSLGRSRGLRIMLITQRPAKLHKDSLTQVETLVAMRLIAPQDRRAVEEWIKDNADEKEGREIISSLATLKTGQGWIWAPEIGVLERVAFPRITTLDSSRAPDGESGPKAVLAPIDRDAIAAKLKAVGADALANDPAALKRRIAELERAARSAPAAATAPIDITALETAAYQDGYKAGVDDSFQRFEQWTSERAGTLHKMVDSITGPPPRPESKGQRRTRLPAAVVARATEPRRAPPPAPGKSGNGAVHLPPGERAVLEACIQYPDGLERSQLTILTGYKRSSRDAYIFRLREKGFVETASDRVTATQAGIDALPDAAPLPTGEELRAFWRVRLPEGERKVLDLLCEAFPHGLARADIDDRTGYKRSSRDAYLSRLAAKELVTEPQRGIVRASEVLFQ